MNEPTKPPNPIAAAMEWVAKITTVALEMFVPAALCGYFFGQGWALVGLVVGVTVGIWHLLQMTRQKAPNRSRSPGERKVDT